VADVPALIGAVVAPPDALEPAVSFERHDFGMRPQLD
jgi:hypothetical protein